MLVFDTSVFRLNCGRYWKPASQFIDYLYKDPINHFHIWNIPEAIYQSRAFGYGMFGALHIVINIRYGFLHDHKFLIFILFLLKAPSNLHFFNKTQCSVCN